MIPTYPNDREYLFDTHENIYQVLGYVHPTDGVYCLHKYTRLDDSDIIIDRFTWKSQLTDHLYLRNIPIYSSKIATTNIMKNQYRLFSPLYGVDFITIPKSAISKYFEPRKKLSQLRTQVHRDFSTLTDQERYAIEISHLFENELGIDSEHIGVTGSILWGGVHANSDIDMVVYGIPNMRRFLKGIGKMVSINTQFRSPTLTEQMNFAGRFSQKSGLSLDDCTVSITHKKFLLYFSKYFLSIAFNPTESEIKQNSLAKIDTGFIPVPNLSMITIRATVKNDDWMYFYPGVIYLDNIHTQEPMTRNFDLSSICRAVVFEHENIGYYEKGKEIEIRGLVQLIKNPPMDVVTKSHPTKQYAQIVIGTSENYGNEYIKNVSI